jgi:hypothetical protein
MGSPLHHSGCRPGQTRQRGTGLPVECGCPYAWQTTPILSPGCTWPRNQGRILHCARTHGTSDFLSKARGSILSPRVHRKTGEHRRRAGCRRGERSAEARLSLSGPAMISQTGSTNWRFPTNVSRADGAGIPWPQQPTYPFPERAFLFFSATAVEHYSVLFAAPALEARPDSWYRSLPMRWRRCTAAPRSSAQGPPYGGHLPDRQLSLRLASYPSSTFRKARLDVAARRTLRVGERSSDCQAVFI